MNEMRTTWDKKKSPVIYILKKGMGIKKLSMREATWESKLKFSFFFFFNLIAKVKRKMKSQSTHTYL